MPRSLVNINPPQNLELKTDRETWTLELRTITPMFGGSATTREVCSQNPIRPSSVRGHLRFWWRATAGAKFSSAQELFEAEEKLWGSGEKHGLVSLRVETVSSATKKPCATFPFGKTFPDFDKYPSYALFPFQGKAEKDRVTGDVRITEKPAETLTDIQFKLHLTYPKEVEVVIQAAVSAWITFGGIGARTRRGCGSLEVIPELSLQGIQRKFENLLTLIPNQYFIGEVQRDSIRAWKEAVELYRDFRQGVPFARNKGSDPKNPRKAGRSRYPEPDTIRRLSPRERWTHSPEHAVQGFPRANLGLPIIFHFIGEGSDHTLQGSKEGQTRFASPMITKAIKTSSGYVPAIIILNSPNVWENGELIINREKVARSKIELNEDERKKVTPMTGKPIREALIAFALSRGFKEIKL